MKKIIASLVLMGSAISMNAAVNVSRIEPTDWYVGMKDASLQLMVYGKDIKNADVTVDYPGVKVDSIARLDSPNYLLVYLNLDGAKAGEMTLNFKQGKQSKKVKYVLKNREMAGDKRIGFSNEDVLYMLMPDRFAMTCCVQDIQFVGFPCSYDGYKALEQRAWVRVTAKVGYKFHNIYRGKGPVLTAVSVEPAEKPLEEVVTFS